MTDARTNPTPLPARAPAFDEARLDAAYHALADVHRRAMLRRLEHGPHTVGELAAPLPVSLAAASKHVQALERAGLVRKEAVGRRRVCSLDAEGLRSAHAWLARYERFWSQRLDALERRLADEGAAAAPSAAAAAAAERDA